MKVSQSSAPQLTSEPETSVEIYPESGNQDDMHWFAAKLNPTTVSAPPSDAMSPGVLGGIAESISGSQRAQKEAFRDLRVASRSSNVEDFSKANAQLSNYYIESLLNAKIIAKGVQSLDKLNNLQ